MADQYRDVLCEACKTRLYQEYSERKVGLALMPRWRVALIRLLAPSFHRKPRFIGDTYDAFPDDELL